ncbi:MAG: 2,3-bisphosphoglycerate-independent phosphoglycerate mutase [Candidatus Magasanikbacteria bacterium]|jgi:2,3-bisphosphoglycerate-independent phosphoglycerate mutase|nr:2,3-bisphosphoglycerate-independent phosphoglycerate mutase [Candidatus Magasanikbacteria bacterium]MBT4220706.1 2,3-bisphosphoglycerate-independent phosphoglycerate mutase [Candidatus Magasanikbacteria bacterium]MBT4350051.1 2,3-bisphosphoglycerate-independent phosphoglycerate mutase [Candidatus Magasanikbacteria bacterium]MBT4541506.1 2,3-bisphosphoglycerate-independent phosphoglycerate mutase [Candidatus Magasanikbacteria bacterium]MBT6253034.1 2,3-bisphosphoglycerate-independent phosphog
MNFPSKKIIPTVLVILDGFGLRDKDAVGNAVTPSTAPFLFSLMETYPSITLSAHGEDVGLMFGQDGNSEAGHLCIGAGRPVQQDIVRVNHAIADGRFFKNEAFKQGILHAKKHNSAIHVMGLLTDGHSAHASPEHVYALLDLMHESGCEEIYIHLFTDGRDAPPHAAITYIADLRSHMHGTEKIASICGRQYAMDRNKCWERTKEAYDMMVSGIAPYQASSAEEALTQAYNRNETDEHISSTVLVDEHDKPIARIKDHDVVFFFNTRSDRARQLTKVFVQPDFEAHNHGTFTRLNHPKDIRFVAMSDFGPDLPGVLTAFPSPDIINSLPCVIDETYKQLYISESEKYAHVTFFINGGYADPICDESRVLIHSEDVDNYADTPLMQTSVVVDSIIEKMDKEEYTFVTVNLPNADMIGHTGDLAAAKQAVMHLDKEVQRLVEYILSIHGQLFITADHGNAEEMLDIVTNEIMTKHTMNPVPCIVVGDMHRNGILRSGGSLCDVAPTLLSMMSIPIPSEMTGQNLFE